MHGERGLVAGAAEVEITPAVGAELAGGLHPRRSVGVQDPLYVKALVLASGGRQIAYVIVDAIALSRETGDRAVAAASRLSGIPPEHIVWAATHTHTGPYTVPVFGPANTEWLDALPGKFASAVEAACRAMRPVRLTCERGFHCGLGHNRRLLLKDGRAINTWNLANAGEVQCLGSAGPVDPEVGILALEDDGGLVAVLFHYALHANVNFGPCFSADYPAVVAARLRERFGPRVVTLFAPGACADINTWGLTYRQVGDALAGVVIERLAARCQRPGPMRLGALKREVVAPFRDASTDQEERIARSGWSPEGQEVFRRELELVRAEGATEARTVLQAWRIGDVGFASLPGELFVEWGLKIKRESPFLWTYPVELGGDYLGYLVTEQAWQAGGYESLIARSAKPSPAGSAGMVSEALDMLRQLHGSQA